LAKVAVQCYAESFVVNQSLFSASTFVVKIATFAKRQNVMGKLNKQYRNGRQQTREPPALHFDSRFRLTTIFYFQINGGQRPFQKRGDTEKPYE
jgi:hypothetical protein